MNRVIDVAKDFSPLPFGRYLTDGKNSATRFREDVLKKALSESHDVVTLDFSDVRIGVGSSFLEEVFGGLVRGGYPAEELKKQIQVTGGMAAYASQILRFIERAEQQRQSQMEKG